MKRHSRIGRPLSIIAIFVLLGAWAAYGGHGPGNDPRSVPGPVYAKLKAAFPTARWWVVGKRKTKQGNTEHLLEMSIEGMELKLAIDSAGKILGARFSEHDEGHATEQEGHDNDEKGHGEGKERGEHGRAEYSKSVALAAKMPPAIEECAAEPVKYVGSVQTDKHFYDGAQRHAVGAHLYQAFRANRSHPSEGGDVGWTYNHQPFLAYWNGKFYLHYLSNLIEEHNPPGRTLLMTSQEGRQWSNPRVIFPEYALPEIRRGDIHIPAGTPSVMHQRMGFYVAPNGRLLALAFYSYCANPRTSPNAGTGLGRVVREIYADGTFGPIYFIRYNRHAGFNESNTNYPFYKESKDKGFLAACEALLADKLMTLQWWEEDRAKDGFYVIDPGDVKNAFPFHANMTTFQGAGKALCFYHRADGVVVALWKNQWSALSADNGKSWTGISKSATLKTCGAKVWGQRTEDGRYALVYNHSATRGNRYPLVVISGDDGYEFDNMLCLHGEVPPQRYQGIHRSLGPQYIRGIVEGNGDPPGGHLWNTYSVNKEDIWVSRLRVPITGTVSEHVNEDFEKTVIEADLELWNLYVPKWAPISIVKDPQNRGNKCLELRDEEPYDHAIAERAFPPSRAVTVRFRIMLAALPQGRCVEFEAVNAQGTRPMRLRLDRRWLYMDHQLMTINPVAITTGKWYEVTLKLDCNSQSYDVAVNHEWVRKGVAFAEKADSLERMVFRTGPYRGDVRALIVDSEPRPSGLYTEDLPDADEKVPVSVLLIDDVKTAGL
ncbi:MAG TPA: hypothetical protein VMW16_15970 [Sedimentisphaerales bacterium]|nr:hypothetical protein [Sedimentisphaerales bacterium]